MDKPKFQKGDIVVMESVDANDLPILSKGEIIEIVPYQNGEYAYEVILQGSRFIQRHWKENGLIQNGVMINSPLYKEQRRKETA